MITNSGVRFEIAPVNDVILTFLPRIIASVGINGQPKKKPAAMQDGGTVILRHRIEFTDKLPPVDVEYLYNFKNDASTTIIFDYLWSDFYSLAKIFEHIPPEKIKNISVDIAYEKEAAPLVVYDARVIGKDSGVSGYPEYWPGNYIYIEIKANTIPDTSDHITAIVPMKIPEEAKEDILGMRILSGNYMRGVHDWEMEMKKDSSVTYGRKFHEWLIESANQSSNTKLYWYGNILLQDKKMLKKIEKELKDIKVDTISGIYWNVLPQEKIIRKTKDVGEEIRPLPFNKGKRQILSNRMVYIKVKPEKGLIEKMLFPDPPPPPFLKKKK